MTQPVQPGAPMAPFRAWIAAARPQTLPAGVTPVVLATAWAMGHGSHANLHVAVFAALGAIAIQIGTNLFNDWADFIRGADTAARLGPARMTQQGHINPAAVRNGALIAFALGAVCGLGLIAAGGWPIIAVGLVSIAAGILYTGGPYPLAYHGLGDLFAFVFFGPVATCATYYLHTGGVTPACWALGIALGAFAAAILVVNNLRDRNTDAAAHKRTLAVRFGPTFCRVQYGLLVLAPYAIYAWLYLPARGSWPYGWLPLMTLPWAGANSVALCRRDGRDLNPLLGRTAKLEMAYALGIAAGLPW